MDNNIIKFWLTIFISSVFMVSKLMARRQNIDTCIQRLQNKTKHKLNAETVNRDAENFKICRFRTNCVFARQKYIKVSKAPFP